MKKIVMLSALISLSGCFNDAFLNKASVEISNVIQKNVNNSLLPIKSMTITSVGKGTSFSVQTHSGFDMDLEVIEPRNINWWVEIECNKDNECTVYMDDETASSAEKINFENLSNTYVVKLVKRVNNYHANTH
jgi:hypothetical protein